MRVILLSALALTLGSGCSLNAVADAPSAAGGSSSGGTGAIIDGQPTGLTFLASPTELAPRDAVTVKVQVSPPGLYTVWFALPMAEGKDPLDAALDASDVPTDETGEASVLLTAPSTSADFRLRASVASSLTVERDFTVTDAGSVTVEVQPVYHPNRVRNVTTWVASARPEETCADLPGIPPPDGMNKSMAARDEAPELSGVEAGIPVAITLRSGHFMGGCTSIEMFPPGPENRRHVVEVTVLNRPIELSQSNLSLALGLNEEDTAFRELNELAGASALSALRGSSTDDADALLDTMRNALEGQPRQSLDSARKVEGWDALVRAHWTYPASRLHDTVAAWLAAGELRLGGSAPLLEGDLRAVDSKSAELTLAAVAGLLPEQAGFVSSSLVSWSADAADTVVLGTDLYLSSSRFATGLATPAALEGYPEAETAEQALALALDCSALGLQLAAAGSDPVFAYDTCNAGCLTELCEQAAAALWQRARDASSTKPVRLALTAAGTASVGDFAEVVGLPGSWVGELASAAKPTGGSLTATVAAE